MQNVFELVCFDFPKVTMQEVPGFDSSCIIGDRQAGIAPAQLDKKDSSKAWETGQCLSSGIWLMSQYTWKMSRPVPYNSFVLSAHDVPIVENYSVVTKVKLLYLMTEIRSCLCKLLNMKPIRDEFSTLPLKEYGEKSKECR